MPQHIEVPGMGVVEFPDGMSDEQIVQAIKGNTPSSTEVDKSLASPTGRFVQGVMDPVRGLAQIVEHALPGDTARNINDFAANHSFGLLTGGTADERAQNQEKSYQAARQATAHQSLTSLVTGQKEQPGLDWLRLAGNIASPANRVVPGFGAKSIGGKIAETVGQGAALGTMQPALDNNEDFASQKLEQASLGGLFGLAGRGSVSGLSKLIKPNVRPEVEALMKEGVTPTPGQILGGGFQRAEEGLTSVPILGDMIKSGQRRGVQQLNTAAINRAVSPIGKQAQGVGNKAIEQAASDLGEAYEGLLPKLQVKADSDFMSDISKAKELSQSLPDAQKGQFERILENEVLKHFTPQGNMSGETMKNIESRLGGFIRGYGKSEDYNQRLLGDALKETQASLRRMVERGNPQYANQLKSINQGYANFLRVQDAAGRIGSKEGIFSPAQLRSAVRSKDSSKGKSAFARGNAMMQDLADAGENVLGPKVPDSGTPFRTLMSAGPIGLVLGAATSPAGLAYTKTGQKLLATALTKRPKSAQKASELVRKGGQHLTPGAAFLANALLSPSD